MIDSILNKIYQNLILEYGTDKDLILSYIFSAIDYAEAYQHLQDGYYRNHEMKPKTEQAVIMLSSHFYESRDGSTAGFFGDNTGASDNVWKTVNRLLQLDREWSV